MSRIRASLFGPAPEALAGGVGEPMFIRTGRAYRAAEHDRTTVGWNARLRAPDDETNIGRDTMVARARDVTRNNPIIAGALDRRAEAVVSSRIRLMAQPAFEVLGETAQWSDDWAQEVEQQFQIWDRDVRRFCDAERRHSFGEIVRTAYQHYWRDGEACAAIMLLNRGSAYRTAVRLIDPDRLSNPDGLPDNHVLPNGRRLVAGIEYDSNGAPVAYHVRVRHPAESGTRDNYRWERILREGRYGRPLFVHAFRADRADQKRGVSKLVSALKRIRMLDTYDDTELEAALLNAVMAATIKTDVPASEVREALAPLATEGSRSEWSVAENIEYREEHPLNLGNGPRVTHLLPNEQFQFEAPVRPAAHYPEFQATGLRSIAAALGLSYPQLSQNWAAINYSSARTLLNEIWRGLLDDRWMFTQAFCTPIYSAFLEEAIAIGKVRLPGGPASFYRYRAELTMCEWFGPGRGSIDPLKESKAADLDTVAGRTTAEFLAAEEGRDIRDVMRSRLRMQRMEQKMGLPSALPAVGSSAAGGLATNDAASRQPNGQFADVPDEEEETDDEEERA